MGRLTEDELRTLAARLVGSAPDAMVVADAAGQIVLWNAGAEATFGYSPAEAVGQTLDLIVPERLRQRHWEGYHRTMESGETKYADGLLSVPAVRKDGGTLSIEFKVTLLTDGDGRPEAIGAVIRDVTAHWEEDRALRTELRRLQAAAGSSAAGDLPA